MIMKGYRNSTALRGKMTTLLLSLTFLFNSIAISAQEKLPGKSPNNSKSYEYLVVTSPGLIGAFDEFIKWKRRKGLNIGIISTEDIAFYSGYDLDIHDQPGALRSTLFKFYKRGLKYVLLAGDHKTVPIRYGTGTNNKWGEGDIYKIPSDLYFSDFDGNWDTDDDKYFGEPNDSIDAGPEIFVGRLLCSSEEEVKSWSAKVIQYEKDPGRGDNSYLTKAFFTQADQMQRDDQARKIAALFKPVYKETTIFEEPEPNSRYVPSFPRGSDVINELNQNNYGLISWFNHGKPTAVAMSTYGENLPCDSFPGPGGAKRKLTSLDHYDGGCDIDEAGNGLDNMQNYSHPSVVYTIACETIPFDDYKHENQKNIGEAFTELPDIGGPIYLGNTRYGYVKSSFELYKKFIEQILDSGRVNFGQAEAYSKRNLNNHFLNLSHNLLGCPETVLWTDVPSNFTQVVVKREGKNVTVDILDVENCRICLMSKGDKGKSFWEMTNGRSKHTFYNVPSSFYVTVTKHNYLPYLRSFPD